jgi:hypothetical protein
MVCDSWEGVPCLQVEEGPVWTQAGSLLGMQGLMDT